MKAECRVLAYPSGRYVCRNYFVSKAYFNRKCNYFSVAPRHIKFDILSAVLASILYISHAINTHCNLHKFPLYYFIGHRTSKHLIVYGTNIYVAPWVQWKLLLFPLPYQEGRFNDVTSSIWKRVEKRDEMCPLVFRKPFLLQTPGKHWIWAVYEVTLK